MGLRIQNNVEAFNTHRQLTATSTQASKSMEKLSSGYRINRAADDAAGLAISEKMRGQIGGLAQAQRNAQDGISLVQTAEGALTEVHSMLQRVRDLKVQFDNGTLSDDDKAAIAAEVARSRTEVKSIVDDTEVQRHQPLFGTRHGFTFQVGANDGETITTRRPLVARRQRRAPAACPSSRLAQHRRDGHDGSLARAPSRPSADRQRDQERLDVRAQPRRGAEPSRAPSEQPGDLPGEPDRVRVAHPRRGHGGRDDEVHEARTSCSRPARACSRRPTRRPQSVLSLLR